MAIIAAGWVVALSVRAAAPALTHSDVYVSGRDGYHTYRIPAIECAPDGTLLAFAEARKYNAGDPGFGRQDIDLVLKHSTDQGATWSPMTVIEDPGELWSAANPATVVDRSNGRVWLFYLRSRPERSTETSRPGTDDFQTLARWSVDNGRTWSAPVDLTSVARDMQDSQWRASVAGPGGAIQTRSGRLVVPMWKAPFAVFTLYSDDHGETWKRGALVPGDFSGDENQVVELPDGRVLMEIRQNRGSHRWWAESRDGGATWAEPRPGFELKPVACAVERLPAKDGSGEGDRVIWTGPKGPDRQQLVLRVSEDDAKTFPRERLISDQFAAYSDLTVLRDGSLGVLWERGVEQGYQFITFTRITRDWMAEAAVTANAAADVAPRVISRGEAAGSYQAFPDVCRLQNGDFLCVFYAGYGHVSLPKPEFPKGGRICMVRSRDEGATWSEPRILFDGPADDRDPHIAQMKDGTLVCTFFTYRPQPGGAVICDTSAVTSRDGGESWETEARVLAAGWPSSAPVRELPDGTRLLGVYREEGDTAYGGLIRSTDAGRTWSPPIPIGKGSGVRLDAETDFVLLTNGTLYAALRGDRTNLHFAASSDLGLTWSAVKDSGFPGHCPHFTRLRGGEILLTHRLPHTALHVSRDDAASWQGPYAIDSTIGAYPSTIECRDATVIVVYYEEGERSGIRVRRFRLKLDGVEFLPLTGPAPRAGASPEPPAWRLHQFEAAKPNVIEFPARAARFVRLEIAETEGGEPCLDEFEIYGGGAGEDRNLALASRGARATASSLLAGYAIHQVGHLNDGRYGNAHSWIAASSRREWAQIELPTVTPVSRVVFSRDREARFADRVPAAVEVRVSSDGTNWTSVSRLTNRVPLPSRSDFEGLLRYAFLCEQATWSRVDPAPPVARVLKQMEAMLSRMEGQGIDVTADRAEWKRLAARQSQAAGPGGAASTPGDDEAAYLEVRAAKRRLFLRDPALAPLRRVLFTARQPYEPSHNYSDILDAQWRPGGGVRVLEIPQREGRLDPGAATVRDLFNAGEGVVRDAVADFEARRVYFAYRAGESDHFHLFGMNADGSGCRQLTEGPFHDYYPCPLPDDGLAFISTRCRARFLCWRPQAFVLFRMEADGGSVRPLSHANLSEWAPSVMNDGRILWTRSEYLDKGADFGHTLWAIRPDGRFPELIFGNNTLNCYVNAREVPGTDELCCTLISHGGDLNGPIGLVRPARGRSNPEAITNLTPDCAPHYHMSWARQECFRDPVPIGRDHFLVSHAPRDRFGLYVIDRYGNRELLYLDPEMGSMSPAVLAPVPRPPVLPHDTASAVLAATAEAEEGTFVLQDVYQGLEPAVARGAVKYLRVCQEVRAELERLPDGTYRNDHPPFEDFYASPTHLVRGPNGWPSYVAKASLGIVPVEADGSASFQAPAGRVLYFEALDADFNELQRMRSVVQLQPGEQRGCIGCHEHRATTGPVRPALALRQPPRRLETPSWGAVPFAYEKVVQPVWNTRCVECHDAGDPQGLDFTGTLAKDRVPASYRTLITQGWVHYFDYTWGQEHRKAEPLTFGTLRSPLWSLLKNDHYGVQLTRDELHRVKCWIDLNCPLWPDYIQRELRPDSLPAEALQTAHAGAAKVLDAPVGGLREP